MRILAISYLFPNGQYPNYGIFVLNRLKAINRYYDVKVINPIPWFPFSTFLERYKNYHRIPKREVIEGIEVFHPRFLIIPRFLKLIKIISFFAAVFPLAAKIKKEFPFDILDIHWTFPDLPTGRLIAEYYKKKQLITLRGKEALFSNGTLYYKKVIIPLIGKSDAIISLSRELADICVAEAVPQEKIHIVRNGVNVTTFYFQEKTKCRERLGLPQNERIVLSVGSLIYGKGHDRIIRIFPEILKRYPDASLYIVGSIGPEGNYRKELFELVKKYSLTGKVRFTGAVKNTDLLLWYNAADIFCLASRGEGSPNVLSEALACGCPSISTDVGAVSEILQNESMGKVIPNNDQSLLPGLLDVLDREYDREMISFVMKKYDWDWCAKKVIKVYKEVLRG